MASDKANTIEFLKSRFRDYYEKCDLYLPDRFGKREFGFMYFESGMMQRHLGFKNKDEVKDFLVQRTPMHAYHSSAYYERPDAPTMDEKGWLGADLIFDLDADHLKNAGEMDYETMLAEVKREFIKLVESYMIDDFGFSKEHLTVVFSGARGYHLHIRDPKILGLQSHERREIVDYISGPSREDIEKFVFTPKPYDVKKFRNFKKDKFTRRMPKMEDFGWKRKMRFGLENLLRELEEMGSEKAVEYLARFDGVGKVTSKGIWHDLFEGKSRGADRMLEEDNIEMFSSDKSRDAFIRVLVESQKVKLEGEADEPVTSDTKRLIRLPTSLHGKTGLLVKLLKLDEIADFNPLRDSIPSTYSSDKVEVKVVQPIDVELRGERFKLSRGVCKVPEYAAIFFMCRRLATKS
jgi:DNA primase small subunit